MAAQSHDPGRILAALAGLPHRIRVLDSQDQIVWSSEDAPRAAADGFHADIETQPPVGAKIRRIDPLDGNFFSKVARAVAHETGFDVVQVSRFIDGGRRYILVGSAGSPDALGTVLETRGAPCEMVLEAEGYRHFIGNLGTMFPADTALAQMDARTYAGSVYRGPSGMVLGHVFGLAQAELAGSDRLEQIFWVATTAVSHALISQNLTEELNAIRKESRIDALTGLLNRAAFDADVQRYAELAQGGEDGLLAYLDLDGMKAVNDTRGHLAGDQLLISFAHALTKSLRLIDSIYRLGGDEFAVLWRGVSDEHRSLMNRRIETAIQMVAARGFADISVSVGTASFNETVGAVETIALADERMYADKRAKRETREQQGGSS